MPRGWAQEVVERKRGDYDRRLRRCRRDAPVAAPGEHFPGAGVPGIAAGLHVVVPLPGRYGPRERFLARVAEAAAR